jgi:hypothetical protein
VYGKSALAGSNFFFRTNNGFQTAAIIKFDRKIAEFTVTDPRTLGTLAERRREIVAYGWRALCVVAISHSVAVTIRVSSAESTSSGRLGAGA